MLLKLYILNNFNAPHHNQEKGGNDLMTKYSVLETGNAGQPGFAYSSANFDGAIKLESGVVCSSSSKWHDEPLVDGLKIVIIGNSEMYCKLSNCPQRRIVGPCICTIWNKGEREGAQSFPIGCNMQYLSVSLKMKSLQSNFGQFIDVYDEQLENYEVSGPKIDTFNPSRIIKNLYSQVKACPYQGICRDMFLSGKALELAAYIIQDNFVENKNNFSENLTDTDIEKIYRANEILINKMQDPPSLSQLALFVGTNTKKLTLGFRHLFNNSVFGQLQTIRLEKAYKLLSEGSIDVSTVAYEIGYSPAHLTVAFKKRFGILPKEMKV